MVIRDEKSIEPVFKHQLELEFLILVVRQRATCFDLPSHRERERYRNILEGFVCIAHFDRKLSGTRAASLVSIT
jgi:hypothetical protein